MVSKNKRLLQRLRVPLGFFSAAVFIIFARPEPITLIVGAFIAAVGLLIRAWASGHIRKNKKLAIFGPYAFTRNPLYLGSFLLGVGFCVAAGVWWLAIIFAALLLGIYLPVMRVESEDLTRLFGAEYQDYADNVPLFFPRFSPWKKTSEKFDFQLYLKYREYRAALGLLSALAILIGKMLFLH